MLFSNPCLAVSVNLLLVIVIIVIGLTYKLYFILSRCPLSDVLREVIMTMFPKAVSPVQLGNILLLLEYRQPLVSFAIVYWHISIEMVECYYLNSKSFALLSFV